MNRNAIIKTFKQIIRMKMDLFLNLLSLQAQTFNSQNLNSLETLQEFTQILKFLKLFQRDNFSKLNKLNLNLNSKRALVLRRRPKLT